MRYFQLQPGRPIYNMQEFLRVIAMRDETLPALIPDGIFGTQTEATVKIFQRNEGLPETGEVDNDTWDRIVEVYTRAQVYTSPPPGTQMFPASDFVVQEGEDGEFMLPIQSMLRAVTRRFSNIPDFELSGVHTGDALTATRELQKFLDTECNGEIDVHCWHRISRLYENLIAKDIFQMRQQEIAPYAMQQPVGETEEEEQFTVTETENREPNRTGFTLAPRLDTYGMGNASETDEIPLPQREDRDSILRPIQPESTILRNMEMDSGNTMRQNAEIGNEELNNTDMQGNTIPQNPNANTTPAGWQGGEENQETPVRTIDTLTEEQRENAGLEESPMQPNYTPDNGGGRTLHAGAMDNIPMRNTGRQERVIPPEQGHNSSSMQNNRNMECQPEPAKKEPLRWNFF